MILINYFASYRDRLNLGGEKIPVTDSLNSVEDCLLYTSPSPRDS